MPIWDYREFARDPREKLKEAGSLCLFCRARLKIIPVKFLSVAVFYVCARCGWWAYIARSDPEVAEPKIVQMRGVVAALKNFDLTDIEAPVSEVRSYLIAKYDSRFNIHPRLFEETVGSVFKDLGYFVEVTGYGNDGGIDAVLRRSRETIGVQVKRYRDKITVEQIRSFAGALVLKDLTRGIFVTTSSFTAGASTTCQRYSAKGIIVELHDSKRFLEALNITQKEPYQSVDDIPVDHGELYLGDLLTVIEERDLQYEMYYEEDPE